jgi:hypothetical protein
MGGLLEDPDKSMFDFDVSQLKSEILDHINELGTRLSTKIDIDDFSRYYNNIYTDLHAIKEQVNRHLCRICELEVKLERMDEWFTKIASYAQYTTNQEFKEITNKISEYNSHKQQNYEQDTRSNS